MLNSFGITFPFSCTILFPTRQLHFKYVITCLIIPVSRVPTYHFFQKWKSIEKISPNPLEKSKKVCYNIPIPSGLVFSSDA